MTLLGATDANVRKGQNSPNLPSARVDFGLWTMPKTDKTSGDRTLYR
jgi:hypothetical protein